jgi:hypothetical protein
MAMAIWLLREREAPSIWSLPDPVVRLRKERLPACFARF